MGGVIGLTEEVIYEHDGILAPKKVPLGRRNGGKRARTGSRESLVKKNGIDFWPRRWVYEEKWRITKKKDSKFFPKSKIQQIYRPTKKVYI